MEFYAQPDAELWWHRSVTVDREAAIADAPGWNGRVDEACSTTIRDARSRDTIRVLVECTVRTPPSPVGIVQLAAASVRIAPSLEADLYVALEFLRKGQFQVSRRHCRRVLETSPSSLLRSMAWENLAYAYVSEENRPEGAAAYRRAFEVSPSRVSPAVFWLTNCIIGGDVTGASCAARAVEEAVPIGHPVIGWAENSLLLFRRKARREALETARSALVEARNENVARIVNAFRS
jgi:tetratricopeptide (TPR) repeat protein